MSCSVHDVMRLERRGVAAVAVATSPFVDEAVEQAHALGIPDARVVYVPHPVQLLTGEELRALAAAAFPTVLAAVTTRVGEDGPRGH